MILEKLWVGIVMSEYYLANRTIMWVQLHKIERSRRTIQRWRNNLWTRQIGHRFLGLLWRYKVLLVCFDYLAFLPVAKDITIWLKMRRISMRFYKLFELYGFDFSFAVNCVLYGLDQFSAVHSFDEHVHLLWLLFVVDSNNISFWLLLVFLDDSLGLDLFLLECWFFINFIINVNYWRCDIVDFRWRSTLIIPFSIYLYNRLRFENVDLIRHILNLKVIGFHICILAELAKKKHVSY